MVFRSAIAGFMLMSLVQQACSSPIIPKFDRRYFTTISVSVPSGTSVTVVSGTPSSSITVLPQPKPPYTTTGISSSDSGDGQKTSTQKASSQGPRPSHPGGAGSTKPLPTESSPSQPGGSGSTKPLPTESSPSHPGGSGSTKPLPTESSPSHPGGPGSTKPFPTGSASIGNPFGQPTPTIPTEPFPSAPNAPSTTVPPAAASSEAPKLSAMFFALYANRDYLKDPKKRQSYIDYVDKTKQVTDNLFGSLTNKPPTPPGCSNNSPGAGDPVSSVLNMVGDMGKLLSCASAVINNLDGDVKLGPPPIGLITYLTGILDVIGQGIDETEKEDQSSSSSSSSCTDGSAVPQCTITTTLSTSYYSGVAGVQSSTVSTITMSSCTTITACDPSATTQMTTVSASSSSSVPTRGIICSPSCKECQMSDTPQRVTRSAQLQERTLSNPEDTNQFENVLAYVEDQVMEPGTSEVEHRSIGRLSSARTTQFLSTPLRLFVKGLEGCTSVAIISERGAWLSHFWESPSMMGNDATFKQQVIEAITDGDGDQMPPAWQPYLFPASDNSVQIFIMTPRDGNGQALFAPQVAQIQNILTGDGQPWANVPVVTHLYDKPPVADLDKNSPEYAQAINNFFFNPNSLGRVLVEYDNRQARDPEFVDDDPLSPLPPERPNPPAIWRILMESEIHFHEWGPRPEQQAPCDNGNRKRDGSCSQPSATISSVSATTTSDTATSSASAADASWSAAAASPSAECWILNDDGFGDSVFKVLGINDWAGDDGSSLQREEDGCGVLSGWQWHTGQMMEFQGRERETESTTFELSFFKGGCVERAIKSAGGPDLLCQHAILRPSSSALPSGVSPLPSPLVRRSGMPPLQLDSIVQSPQDAVQNIPHGTINREWQEKNEAAAPRPTRTIEEKPTHTKLVENAKTGLSRLLGGLRVV